MELDLSLLSTKKRVGKPVYVKCVETGQVARITKWVDAICQTPEFTRADMSRVYSGIRSAIDKGHRAYGLQWERVPTAEGREIVEAQNAAAAVVVTKDEK